MLGLIFGVVVVLVACLIAPAFFFPILGLCLLVCMCIAMQWFIGLVSIPGFILITAILYNVNWDKIIPDPPKKG